MKRIILIFSICSIMLSSTAQEHNTHSLKILHLALHKGCIEDFIEVAQELSLDLTSWYIHADREKFDNQAPGNSIYNIGHDRAKRIWERNKDYFNQFDVIITSDTAPLSRIFLQNNWTKPLIIWICNRFDYHDGASLDCHFPDPEYYELFRKALTQKNVHIISYTPYEYHYANRKGVAIGTDTIKPIGTLPKKLTVSAIPSNIKKQESFFIYPRLDEPSKKYVQKNCSDLNITAYYGSYNGADDLTDFKGIIYFPYAWSNLALFENMQRGIVHFVPTEQFILKNESNIYHFTLKEFNLCEWYCDEYRDLFVYFDSWEDLKNKIATTNYHALREKNIQRGKEHRQIMLSRWNSLFQEISKTIY